MKQPSTRRLLSAIALSVLFFCPVPASSQTSPPAWNPTANYKPGDLVAEYGNYYRCYTAVTNSPDRDPSKYYTSWQLYNVQTNTSLLIGVGQPFPSFQDAWNYAQNAIIAEGAYLHLNILTTGGPLVQNFSQPLNLDHAFGGSISIVGDDAQGISFKFPGNGIALDDGHCLAEVANIGIVGSGTGTGVSVIGNASLGSFSSYVNNFAIGVSADQGAHICCTSDTNIVDCSTVFSSTRRANVILDPYTRANQYAFPESQYGVYATLGGHIEASGCFMYNCAVGAFASEGGTIDSVGGYYGEDGVGVEATMKGHVDCTKALFGDPTPDTVDIECNTGSTVDRSGAPVDVIKVGTDDGSYVYGP